MQSNPRAQAEVQAQRKKLADSYKQLLDEFSSGELRTVGNYALGRLIGKGSFGKVYLATHKLTNGSKVVLKSAKKDDANLAREIHHHRQFLHPHIARLYEVIVTESLVWLVLEYCPGDELYNYLLDKGALEPAKVQKIFTQLVGAVSYVHNKSCVHRDLKLENILLDKYENVKLVDFGFTREYEGKSNYLQTWCGTICYSAPEMLKGEKYAGEKVDVWSLGIILFALLAGELPFDDDDETVTKTRILKEDPKYPDNFPPQAKELCQLLLSKRPLLRPTLADILQNPWLAEHAPRQQEILKLQQPAPFTTDLEKEVLQRMRSAGVDIDMVIENVLAQRCDSLAGWWALLLEKEERKAKRRERRRREKEAEAKSLRRLSAASSRLDKLAPTIKETDEEGLHSPLLGDPPKSRGRALKRLSSAHSEFALAMGGILSMLLTVSRPL
jgi:serine/threonine protein kinase